MWNLGRTRAIRRIGLLCALTIALAAAVLVTRTAAAQTECDEGTLPGGALYRICVPSEWNGVLVFYAHGYVAPNQPLRLPDDELSLPSGGTVDQLLTGLGYAFATTSYRINGLATQAALADLLELNARFNADYPRPARRVLIGASDGGLVAVLAAERYPAVFDGALALCGPYGGAELQANYFGDFRVLFDYFFPSLMPPSPVDIPPSLLETWETTTYSTTVKPVVFDPANRAMLDQLVTVAGIPDDAQDQSRREPIIERLLWYNVYATNDARAKLGGQPFDNRTRVYSGSSDDARLNQEVQRFDADPAALATLAADYAPTGALRVPVITLHTSDDPLVPVLHSQLYSETVAAAGASTWLESNVIDRFGHCNFTPLELVGYFNQVVERAEARARALYLPAMLAAQQ